MPVKKKVIISSFKLYPVRVNPQFHTKASIKKEPGEFISPKEDFKLKSLKRYDTMKI